MKAMAMRRTVASMTTGVERRAPRVDARRSTTCPVCQGPKLLGCMRCDDCMGLHISEGALIDPITRYADDVACQLFVASYPDGAPLEVIGDAMGVSKQRIAQIEIAACRRFLARCKLADITLEDARALFARGGEPVSPPPWNESAPRAGTVPGGRATPPVELEPSDFTRERLHLLDVLDEVIALGEFVALAARYSEAP